MELAQFLARTVAPGGYIAISCNPDPAGKSRGWNVRLFAEGDHAGAASYVRWANEKMGWEAYHGQGSYKTATPKVDEQGRTKYSGSRNQDNVGSLRSFWIDLDCKRVGDGKDPATVFADRAAAVTWLKAFVAAVGIPMPNQMVNSGYGFHCYWLLEDAMLKHQWQPYADALAAAMVANSFLGDQGITPDSARLLRPVGSHNRKSGVPVPVELIKNPNVLRGEIPNQIMLTALQPFVGAAVARQASGTAGAASTVVALSSGAPPPAMVAVSSTAPNMAAAAGAGIVKDTRPRFFERIATECHQARQSLQSRGNGDPYPLWYVGFVSLLTFLDDGDKYLHALSDGDPRYSPAATDAAMARARAERAAKPRLGAPTCQMFERGRAGVCGGCPHFGKIVSPVSLGIKDGDLPVGYRRENGSIDVRWFDPMAKMWSWKEVISGDVHSPTLDNGDLGYQLMFTYERAGRSFPVAMPVGTLVDDAGKLAGSLARQHITVARGGTTALGEFFMAWINKLRDMRAERVERIAPFGWASRPGQGLIGLAIAGTLYRPDNSTPPRAVREAAPGGDKQILGWYTPQGNLSQWRIAADFVCANRVDLQVLVAASFGAPLMHFTGQRGLMISTWSRDSSVGKSSALEIARSVWGSSSSKNSLQDTHNQVTAKLAAIQILPIFWDEMRTDDETGPRAVQMVFNITEGKEKGRLNSDASLKPVSEWETLVVATSNQSLMDLVVHHTAGTNAGALRLFEYEIKHPQRPQNPAADLTVALTRDHYGRAGEVFAEYVGLNHVNVAQAVRLELIQVQSDLAAGSEERFFVAGIAAMLVGAKIATRRGIFGFDLAGLRAELYRAFFELRAGRSQNVLVGNGTIDAEQILSMFMADSINHRVITDRYARQGQVARVVWEPVHMPKLQVHISDQDKLVRFSRSWFFEWARKRNLPGRSIVETMCKRWGAVEMRLTLGGGTIYGGGSVWCVEVPLTHPETLAHQYLDPNAKPPKQAGVAAQAGATP